MKTKLCSRCRLPKRLDQFNKHANCKDGLARYCKACNVEYQRDYRATESGRNRHKNGQLRSKYGITLDQYMEMHKKQNGSCKICGNPEFAVDRDGNVKMLAVDHDPITGRVRGLLCQCCNVGIGNLQHDVERLKKAIKYLNETAAAIP